MNRGVILLLGTLLLIGCEGKMVEPTDTPYNSPTKEPVDQSVSLLNFFPKNTIEKQFLGKGNEFAQYTEIFYKNEGDYYPTIVDNGGTRLLRIYKVTEKEISIVYEQPEYYDKEVPSISSLEDAFHEKPLLSLPLEKGKMNGDWKVVNLDQTITVPYGKFTDVIVLEKTNMDGSINKQYWVEKHGKIKEEYYYQDENGNVFEVTSELEKIK